MSTGLMWDEGCMWHNSGLHFGPSSRWIEPIIHPENTDGKRRIKNLLDVSGVTKKLVCPKFKKATEKDILMVHSAKYLSEVSKISETGGGNLAKRLATTHIGVNGLDIALLAAGGAISAVKAVLEGTVDNAYALIRPPGHHAEVDEALGFCIFANAALAGKYALEVYGLERIAFVDWDVHHGNGTESIFLTDPRALTISIHQENCFPPNSGGVDQTGLGDGEGTNLNIPLPPGSGERAYLAVFDQIIKPALKKFRPQLIIVPCGFDAGFHDPLGRMMLTSHSFRRLTGRIMDVAQEFCNGKLVLTHEGGYSPHTVPFHCLAVIEQLSGITSEVVDPFSPPVAPESTEPLLAHQEVAINRVKNILD
jgi:acetoin utilization deacetylase AcuC-like enzyme